MALRYHTIRLAASLPANDPTRRHILAVLRDAPGWARWTSDVMPNYFEWLEAVAKAARIPEPKTGDSRFYEWESQYKKWKITFEYQAQTSEVLVTFMHTARRGEFSRDDMMYFKTSNPRRAGKKIREHLDGKRP